MECPKCKSIIDDEATVCPYCRKVLLLECPNCHSHSESAVCEKCGYTILVKCSKCSKLNPVNIGKCSKCGFSLKTSLAYQECETDEFASLVINFENLRKIRKLLKSQELYAKFYYKLKNLLFSLVKLTDCKLIIYGDLFVVNFNKELSLATSSDKAVRLALKIVNAFVSLNKKVMEEFALPLNLVIYILKKNAEELQDLVLPQTNVKLLTVNKNVKKYLKGFQVVLDQHICDSINKDYKTDSLFTVEENGVSTVFYEIILGQYVLPLEETQEDDASIKVRHQEIKTDSSQEDTDNKFAFKIFDINAKCSFERVNTVTLFEKIRNIDFEEKSRIVALKAKKGCSPLLPDLVKYFEDKELNVLRVCCTQEMNYKPWGVLTEVFKDYFRLALHNRFNDINDIPENMQKLFKPLFELVFFRPAKAMTAEDSRFNYMESWSRFFAVLSKTVIIIEGAENLDDTTLQTLELYFDKFRNIKPSFVFLTTEDFSLHSKIKGLLRTDIYTEFSVRNTSIDTCLSTLKTDATDFIQSFYYERIKSSYSGSYQYFVNALKYLQETGVLADFENKLIIKSKKSVVMPKDLSGLLRARIKNMNKNQDMAMILAYSSIIGNRIDLKTLENLGIKDVAKNAKLLAETGLASLRDNVLYINNFSELQPVITASLKKEAEEFLAKNILAQLGKGLDDATLAIVMGRMSAFKEEYLTLWKNSQFSIKTGDYDAYLKNCLGFLSLVEHIGSNISKEAIEENKKEVYNNILMFLYAYSPAKIYNIENILLMDAIEVGDDDKIVKLSNLMLQGALLSSNYTDALGLLHNILSRMEHPTLKIDGALNTKFLLLSLVNIEILYNIGNFKECVEITEEILQALTPDLVDKIKPASFSTNLFISHILETCRLAGLAKLYLLDDNFEDFFGLIQKALGTDLPEKDCILALKDYFAGKVYPTKNVETYSAFSKVIFLIIQEFSNLRSDYKKFAQNIYQAKLLAVDIHQKELELFCDLLIAYAYAKAGATEKSEYICEDVLEKAEHSAMFNMIIITIYLLAKIMLASAKSEEGLLLINDSLALIRKGDNQSKILYALLEKLYINAVQELEINSVDLESEEQKLAPLKESLKVLID